MRRRRVARSCIEQAYSKHLPNCSEGGPLLAVFCKGRVLTALTLLVFLPASSSRQGHSPGFSPSLHPSNLESCSTATAPVPSPTRASLDWRVCPRYTGKLTPGFFIV